MKLIRWVEDHLSGRKRKTGTGDRKSLPVSSSLLHYPSTQLQFLHHHQQQLQHHNHQQQQHVRQQHQLVDNVLVPMRRPHVNQSDGRQSSHRMASSMRSSSTAINQTASYMPWNRSSSHSYSSHHVTSAPPVVSMDQRCLTRQCHHPHHQTNHHHNDVYEKEEYLTVILASGSSSPSSSGSGNDNDPRMRDDRPIIGVVHHQVHDLQDEDCSRLRSSSHFMTRGSNNRRRVCSSIGLTTPSSRTALMAEAEPSPRTRDRSRIITNPWLRSPWSTPRQSSYSESSSGSASDRSTDSGCSTTGLNDSHFIVNQKQKQDVVPVVSGNATFSRGSCYRSKNKNSQDMDNENGNTSERGDKVLRKSESIRAGAATAVSAISLMTCQSMSVSSVTSASGNSCSVSKESSVLSCPSNRSSMYSSSHNDGERCCLSRESIHQNFASSDQRQAPLSPKQQPQQQEQESQPAPPDHSYSQLMLQDLLSNLISSRGPRIRGDDVDGQTTTSGSSSGSEDHHPYYRPVHRVSKRDEGKDCSLEPVIGTKGQSENPLRRVSARDNEPLGRENDDDDDDGDEEDTSSSSSSCHSSGLSSASEIVWNVAINAPTGRSSGRRTGSPAAPKTREEKKSKGGIRKTLDTKTGGSSAVVMRTTSVHQSVCPKDRQPHLLTSPSSPPITPSPNRSSFHAASDTKNLESGTSSLTAGSLIPRPTSFCSALLRGKDSNPSSISSSCTSARGLSCSSSSIPAGRRYPFTSMMNKNRRFSLIPSSSFCQQRGVSGTRVMNEEWVSTATDLLCCSDEETDEVAEESIEGLDSSLVSTPAVAPDATDGATDWDQECKQIQRQEDKMDIRNTNSVTCDQEDESQKLRDELQEFVTSVFRTEMQRLNQD